MALEDRLYPVLCGQGFGPPQTAERFQDTPLESKKTQHRLLENNPFE
jgi:hypothetical protein